MIIIFLLILLCNMNMQLRNVVSEEGSWICKSSWLFAIFNYNYKRTSEFKEVHTKVVKGISSLLHNVSLNYYGHLFMSSYGLTKLSTNSTVWFWKILKDDCNINLQWHHLSIREVETQTAPQVEQNTCPWLICFVAQ